MVCGGILNITNSTISGNTADFSVGVGGGIRNGGTLILTNSAISGNSASVNGNGGGFANNGTATLNNSIIANNTNGDCRLNSGIINADHSLIEDNLTCVNGTNTNNIIGDPMLGELTGSPAYFPLLPSSIAIDAGSNSICPATDQRAASRPMDGNGDGTPTCDLGSYEFDGTVVTDTPTSTHTPTDTATSTPTASDTATDTPTATATPTSTLTPTPDFNLGCPGPTVVDNGNALRNLIDVANTNGQNDTITLQAGCTYTLSATLHITAETLTILGNGAWISGDHALQVFLVDGGATLHLHDLVVSDGQAANGGALFNAFNGTVTTTNSTFATNRAGTGTGGAIYNAGSLATINTSFYGNHFAAGNGSAISNYGSFTATNTTFAYNTGVAVNNLFGIATLNNSTFTGNFGSIRNAASLTLNNSILADSQGVAECTFLGGTINASHSLIEDGLSCVSGTSTNNLTGDPALGTGIGFPFGAGSIGYFPLLPGSIAIDAGSNSICPATDQRGAARPVDGNGDGIATCDLGAYEFDEQPPSATPTATPTSTETPTATATSTATYTFTSTSSPTATSTSTPTASTTVTPTETATGSPTATGTMTPSPTSSQTVYATMTPTGTLTVVADSTYPPPPDIPDAASLNSDPNSVVRVGIPDALATFVNVRVLYQNGSPTMWFGASLYDGGSIGIQGILDLGVLQAVDIFSPAGITYFDGGAVFCLRGTGTLIWLDASNAPRIAEIIGNYIVPEFPGFTCATPFEPGTLALVERNPLQ